MVKKPFISAIVLCYKVEKYLPQCLESLRRQTFKDFEVIMVDDGSPDGCGIICDTYQLMDSRFRAIHKENGGIVAARKTALHAARGLWTVSVDGDDWASLDMLEKLAQGVTKYDVDYVQCSLLKHYKDRTVRSNRPFPYGLYMGEAYRNAVINNGKRKNALIEVSLCRALLKTDVLREIMDELDDQSSLCEDATCMAIYAARASGLLQIEDELYHYRARKQSCTTTLASRNTEGLFRLYAHMEEKIAGSPLGEAILREFGQYFADHYLITVEMAVCELDKQEREKYIRSAVSDTRFASLARRKIQEEMGLHFSESMIYSRYIGAITEEAIQKQCAFLADEGLYE